MKMSEVQTLFGVEKMRVDYSFKGKPAVHMIFETSLGKSFARFTFIENVLTDSRHARSGLRSGGGCAVATPNKEG
jgi:hypothetical protein